MNPCMEPVTHVFSSPVNVMEMDTKTNIITIEETSNPPLRIPCILKMITVVTSEYKPSAFIIPPQQTLHSCRDISLSHKHHRKSHDTAMVRYNNNTNGRGKANRSITSYLNLFYIKPIPRSLPCLSSSITPLPHSLPPSRPHPTSSYLPPALLASCLSLPTTLHTPHN